MRYYIQIDNDKIISYSNLPSQDYENIEVSKDFYDYFVANQSNFYVVDGQITEKTQQEIIEEVLAEQFFNTSLGNVRRKVTMKDGSTRDFLSDILPLLQVGVPILVYTNQLEQLRVLVTEQFINECKQQMLQDFYGVE